MWDNNFRIGIPAEGGSPMARRIVHAIREGSILVSDGAWGTAMYRLGLQPGECPELWNISHSDEVRGIARGYAAAGADLIGTNSFGGNTIMLARFGLAERAAELNETAARLTRSAIDLERWVSASLGTTGKMLIVEEVTEEELYETYREQAMALERGGADALCFETMNDAAEAAIAVRAAKENTHCEVICTFTFAQTVRGDFRTLMGASPSEAIQAVLSAGADIIGTNCGNGTPRMIEIVREIRAAFPAAPILVQANAGLPQVVDGQDVYPENPEFVAGLVPAMVAAGANIIGGCCGTTADHIRAIRQVVDQLNQRR
jgi:5-methyltetrahydrofolate--homocysteine methyltransferase